MWADIHLVPHFLLFLLSKGASLTYYVFYKAYSLFCLKGSSCWLFWPRLTLTSQAFLCDFMVIICYISGYILCLIKTQCQCHPFFYPPRLWVSKQFPFTLVYMDHPGKQGSTGPSTAGTGWVLRPLKLLEAKIWGLREGVWEIFLKLKNKTKNVFYSCAPFFHHCGCVAFHSPVIEMQDGLPDIYQGRDALIGQKCQGVGCNLQYTRQVESTLNGYSESI